jgi:hypothetical protein
MQSIMVESDRTVLFCSDAKRIKSGSFDSLSALIHQVTGFEVLWNAVPEPFEWTYTTEDLNSLLEKVPEID